MGLVLTATVAGGVWLWQSLRETGLETNRDQPAATVPRLVIETAQPPQPGAGAIDWMLDHGEPHEATVAAAERMLRRWAVRTPTEAWDFAATDGLAEQAVCLKAVAHVWFEADPRAALDAAVSHGRWQVLRESWVADLAAGWARAAPYAAADWLRTLTASTRHRALLAAVHAPLSVAAPHEALAIAQELGAGEMAPVYSATMYRRQLRRLLGDDPRVLAHWLARQPDDDLRFGFTGSIAEIYEESYPDEALRWALALPGKESREALGVVIWAIAEDDLDYAEAIVLHTGDPDAQAGAAAALLGHWASKRGEPAAAHEWSSKNLSAAVRGEAARGLFSVWGLRDPSAAASAVAAIGDADERRAALAGALWGAVMGVGGDETAQRLRERMLALERLYQRHLRDVPNGGDGAGGEEGDLTSYKLYHYWKDVDPDRAEKYKRKAERYEGPTQ